MALFFIAEGESNAIKGVGFLGVEMTAVVVVIGCELRKEVMLPETINFKLREKESTFVLLKEEPQ